MAKNDLLLIDSILEERVQKCIPSSKLDEAFEYLAYEQVLKEYDLTQDELLSGSVDGNNDGGIDAIYIFVNGHLITDINAAIWPKVNAEVEVYFFTCKHRNSFKQDTINGFFTSLDELLDFTRKIENLDGIYNDDVLEKRTILIETYKKTASILRGFTIKLIYACRGDLSELGENVEARGKQVEKLCEKYFSGCLACFEFWGSEEILAAYRKKAEYSLTLEVEKYLSQGSQYVVLTNLKKYFDFISFENQKLKKYLFDSNVRDFMGLNAVNTDIMDSLNSLGDDTDFWWLNNGITILCTNVTAIGNSISMKNVQIVNGLQTSECIHKFYSENHLVEEERLVLIKIISCDNSQVRDRIIKSTNNQTAVHSYSLRAMDKIQRDIEDILVKEGMYYQRRANFYSNQGIENNKIYNPVYLAQGCTSLILHLPWKAAFMKSRFMRNEELYSEVFSDKYDIRVWPKIARIMRSTDLFLSKKKEIINYRERVIRGIRPLIAYMTISRLLGNFIYSIKDFIEFNINLYTQEETFKTWDDISQDFNNASTKWRSFLKSKNKILPLLKKYGIKQSIANFEALEAHAK